MMGPPSRKDGPIINLVAVVVVSTAGGIRELG